MAAAHQTYPTETASNGARPRAALQRNKWSIRPIARLSRVCVGKTPYMLLILALLLVLILFGAGFAVHLLWIAAVIFAVIWLVGFALGRGEGAGRHRFYRW